MVEMQFHDDMPYQKRIFSCISLQAMVSLRFYRLKDGCLQMSRAVYQRTRKKLAKVGPFELVKDRCRIPSGGHEGKYAVIDRATRTFVVGPNFSADLDECERFADRLLFGKMA